MLLFLCCTAYGKPDGSILIIDNLCESEISIDGVLIASRESKLEIIDNDSYRKAITVEGKQLLEIFSELVKDPDMVYPVITRPINNTVAWVFSSDGCSTYRLQIANGINIIKEENKKRTQEEQSQGIYSNLFTQSSEDKIVTIGNTPPSQH